MSKYANKHDRQDGIPRELVARHVRTWISQYDGNKFEAARALSMRGGIDTSYFTKLCDGTTNSDRVKFDTADAIFCLLGDPLAYWLGDEELAGLYESCAKGADFHTPITEEGMRARAERTAERIRAYRASPEGAAKTRAAKRRYAERQRAAA